METITLTIDGKEVKASRGTTLLEAARRAEIYIPGLCAHPDLPPSPGLASCEIVYRGSQKAMGEPFRQYQGCQLCMVEIEGSAVPAAACTTLVAEGMMVHTTSAQLEALRRDKLALILTKHPHACLICPQREGCDRLACSLNVPVEERCCQKFANCEVRKVADYIGIKEDTPRYVFRGLPIVRDEPLFDRDYNLCINCMRCVTACRDLRGVSALGFVYQEGEPVVGSLGPSLRESGCKFCTACVEVCPTGTLMDRGVKAAQREATLVPCRSACPAGIDVPRYVHLIAEGRHAEALAVVREKVPFPAVLGRVCFHPCEPVCRRAQLDEPIAICALKRFAAERDTGLWKAHLRKAPATGKRVAIVGSGPAGLTAAYYLARLGHGVTIFEALPEPGGMMRYGIPEYRLPKEVLQAEIQDILDLGVELRTNTPIGDGLSLGELRQGFDATFMAVGSQLSRKLSLEGIEKEGVLWGLDFLRAVRMGRATALGDRVIVIGGGNVAIDVALTALRLGAKEVQLACLESREEMPAFEWEIGEALEEGVVLNNSWGPKRILGDGKVAGIELVRCTAVFDAEGRFNPSFDSSVTTKMDAETVILAIGQAADLSFLGKDNTFRLSRGNLLVDDASLETGVSGVFAGGEVVKAPGSIVEAIAAGRRAAIAIDRYLGGKGNIDETLTEGEEPQPWLGRDGGFAMRPRVQMPCLPLEQRGAGFAEVELGFDEEMAVREAKRCLRCDLRLHISPVTLPPEPWLEFNAGNVSAVSETEGVFQLLDAEKKVILIQGTPNLRQALEEQLGNPKARYFLWEENMMYTMRESELIQHFLQKHGRLPEGNDELSDLF